MMMEFFRHLLLSAQLGANGGSMKAPAPDLLLLELTDLSQLPAILAGVMLLLAALAGGGRTLHLLGVLAGLLLAVTFVGSGSFAGVIWAAAFVLANAFHLARIVNRQRGNTMTPEQRELIETVFQIHDPSQQRHLLGTITWRDAKAEEVLMWQGQRAPPLVYLARGEATIEHDGVELGTCHAGEFIGEMSLISGQRATATATVPEAARIAVFDRSDLLRLSTELPELARALDHTFNRGLAEKVQRMNKTRVQD